MGVGAGLTRMRGRLRNAGSWECALLGPRIEECGGWAAEMADWGDSLGGATPLRHCCSGTGFSPTLDGRTVVQDFCCYKAGPRLYHIITTHVSHRFVDGHACNETALAWVLAVFGQRQQSAVIWLEA